MGPRVPPSLRLRRAELSNPGEALAETGRGDDDCGIVRTDREQLQ